jgi:glycosyltransferase involved in cell wall biosynthesis
MKRSCVNGLITIPNLSYSAVLTVFNAEKTVGRAIQSILAQSLSPAEIFIIDDNSQDRSCQIIRDFVNEDPRISIIENKSNLGQSHNRNLGVTSANSDFVIFFDDDDYSLPDRAVEHRKMLMSGATVSFVSSDIHYENGYSVAARNLDYVGVLDFQALARKLLLGKVSNQYTNLAIPASTLAVRTQEFKSVGGFDPSLRRLEDVDLALKYAQSRQVFGFSSAPLVARHSTLSVAKGNGIDMKFEALLLDKYKVYFSNSEYAYAQKHCRTRQLYFSKKYLLLSLHLVKNPIYSFNLLMKPKSYTRRLIHDYKRKSNK